jgi:hypothetical protein
MTRDIEKAKAPLSYLVPASLKQALQDLADADRRKLGPYFRLALEAHVMQAKQKGPLRFASRIFRRA